MVEHNLAKVGVAGSNPVSRSLFLLFIERYWNPRPGGGTGRRAGLKILWPFWPCGFNSHPGYFTAESLLSETFWGVPSPEHYALIIGGGYQSLRGVQP